MLNILHLIIRHMAGMIVIILNPGSVYFCFVFHHELSSPLAPLACLSSAQLNALLTVEA